MSGTKTILIRGENPILSEIKTYGSSIGTDNYWFFWNVVQHESSNYQFMYAGKYKTIDFSKFSDASFHFSEQKGLPLWGYPKGYGLCQLDNWNGKTCSVIERWNWKENLKGGIEVLESKYNGNNSPVAGQKKLVNNVSNLALEDFTIGNVIFTLGNSTYYPEWNTGKEVPADKKSFLDAAFIKTFNGGSIIKEVVKDVRKETDPTTKQIHEVTYYKIILNENMIKTTLAKPTDKNTTDERPYLFKVIDPVQ